MTTPPITLGRYVVPDMPSADELLPWLRQIDEQRWYSNFGPLNTLFEQRVAAYLTTGAIAVTTMMSCYHALQIGLQVMHLPPQAQVLVPAVTFPACPLAVQHAGGVPVLADIDPATWQLTPAIARRIAARQTIHAVMPVAIYGAPVPAAEWDAFVNDTGIPVIIDAAAAFETQAIPQRCLVAHSLHATKPFAVGEGGLLIGRDPAQIDEARRLSNFGTQLRITLQDGGNAKLSEYGAAVGLAQLERRAASKHRRQTVYAGFVAALQAAKLPFTLQQGVDPISAGTLMLAVPGHAAAAIVARLNADGIAAHRMYLPPLYRHPHFAQLTIVDGAGNSAPVGGARGLPQAEVMNRTVFGLPFHVFLTEADIMAAVAALTDSITG